MRQQAPGWQRLAIMLRVGPLEHYQIVARLGKASGGAITQARQKGLIEKGAEGWQLVKCEPEQSKQDRVSA